MVTTPRLLKAAASAEMRRKMDIEDEIYSALEKRDTEILQKNKLLEEQSQQLEEKDQQLEEKDQQLEEQNQQLEAQREMLRNSVRMLLQHGLSEQTVADSLNITLQDIKQLTEPLPQQDKG